MLRPFHIQVNGALNISCKFPSVEAAVDGHMKHGLLWQSQNLFLVSTWVLYCSSFLFDLSGVPVSVSDWRPYLKEKKEADKVLVISDLQQRCGENEGGTEVERRRQKLLPIMKGFLC